MLALVAANGFFVAVEFSPVAVRRSRVTQLVEAGKRNAGACRGPWIAGRLSRACPAWHHHLVAGAWLSRRACAGAPDRTVARSRSYALAGSHAIAVAIAFTIITALHIVLGELAPKSLALQKSEATALGGPAVPAFLFCSAGDRFAERPRQPCAAAMRLASRTAEESMHSPKRLSSGSQQARRPVSCARSSKRW